MANIAQYLANILSARYGKDVRQSIHDALDAVNTSAEGSAESAEEAAEKAEAVAKDLENVKLQAEATTELMGAVKYDGTTIKKNDSGQLTVGEIEEKGIKFKLPVSLSNIVSGESLAVLFGKIHDYIESFISSFETHGDDIGLLQEKSSSLETNKIDYDDTVDDLISTSSRRPLSANMGRELAERIDSLNTDLTNKGSIYDGVAFLQNIVGGGVSVKVGTIYLDKGNYLLIVDFLERVGTEGIPFTLDADSFKAIHWRSNGNYNTPYTAQLICICTLQESRNIDLYIRQWTSIEIESSVAYLERYKAIKL